MIPRLCYITDGERGTAGRPLDRVVREALRGGPLALLLRERTLDGRASEALIESLLPLRRDGLTLLVSRRLDLARAFALDGVQLAADAVPVRVARDWLGPDALLGYSAHSREEALRVAEDGADFVMLSPIFATDSKPGAPGRGLAWLEQCTAGLPIPVLALGGVTPERTGATLGAGAWGVAAVSAIGAARDPADAVHSFRSALEIQP